MNFEWFVWISCWIHVRQVRYLLMCVILLENHARSELGGKMDPDFMGQGSETMCIICVTPCANLWCNSLNNVIYFEMQMKNKFNYVLFIYIQFYFAWIFKIWNIPCEQAIWIWQTWWNENAILVKFKFT